MTLKPGHEIVIEELVAKAKELNDENKRLRKGIERILKTHHFPFIISGMKQELKELLE